MAKSCPCRRIKPNTFVRGVQCLKRERKREIERTCCTYRVGTGLSGVTDSKIYPVRGLVILGDDNLVGSPGPRQVQVQEGWSSEIDLHGRPVGHERGVQRELGQAEILDGDARVEQDILLLPLAPVVDRRLDHPFYDGVKLGIRLVLAGCIQGGPRLR